MFRLKVFNPVRQRALNTLMSYSQRSVLTRMFSTASSTFEESREWRKMSEEDRMACALLEAEPQTAKMAYYRGLACKKSGSTYFNEAIACFERSIELDETYASVAEADISGIYEAVGQVTEALTNMKKAYSHLAVTKQRPEKIKKLREETGVRLESFLP